MFQKDESTWPILVTTWSRPHSAESMRGFLAWQLDTIERARKRGEKLAYVHNALSSEAIRADTRKVVTEWRQQNPDIDDVMIGNWVVSHQAAVRGILVALGWFIPQARTIHIVPTMEDAFREARTALERAATSPAGPGVR